MPIQNISINATAPASPYKHLREPQRNVLLNTSPSSCTCNGDHAGLLIKTGSIQKQRTMTQTTIRNFQKDKGEVKHSKTGGVVQMVVV